MELESCIEVAQDNDSQQSIDSSDGPLEVQQCLMLQPSFVTHQFHIEYKISKVLSQRVLNSCALERILIFLDQEKAIEFQQLNKFMYKKAEQLLGLVFGHKIEPCITLYSDYQKKGAVSVIVGRVSKPLFVSQLIDKFNREHLQFSQKYEFGNMIWPCVEDKTVLVALYKFKHERKGKLKAAKSFYSNEVIDQICCQH